MKILITGSRGMLGKNILEHSKAKNYEFLTPNSKELNLLESFQVDAYFKKHDIDMVMHCAGLVGGIQANLVNPVDFLNNNLCMGMNLVNGALRNNVENFINMGSTCMYPKDYNSPLEESYILAAPLEPTNEGYALAKITVAKLCEYISKQYKLNYKTLIPCNLYGRWDKFGVNNSHMIPAAIRKIDLAKQNNDKVVEIWGSGNARREFMYASDCADAIFYALERIVEIPQYMNIGLGYDYSVNNYYNYIAQIIGYHGAFAHDLSKPEGMLHKLSSITLLNNLGWNAQYDITDGITKTYQFYKEYINE